MLKNYLLIALRTLRRQKGYAALNVVGLAVGVACCLFLLLFVRDELSYDRFHEEPEALFRLHADFAERGREIALTPALVGPLLERELPEVQTFTRLVASGGVVRAEERVFDEGAFHFADSTFFEVFTHAFLAGDAETALDRPNTVVLTASTAERYFGDADPIGQTLVRNNDETFEVTGVMVDVPANSHYRFDFLASFSTLPWVEHGAWTGANFYTYVRTRSVEAGETLPAQVSALLSRLEEAGESPWALRVVPVTDIHLHSRAEHEIDATGDATYVKGFTLVALLILLIACINYMNLATARAGQRAKEVGLRKSLGAFRGQLVRQFFSESAVLTSGGLALALVLVGIGLPWFNEISGKALTFGTLGEPEIIALVIGTFLVVSVVAGSYPALYLSGFQPARVLRGRAVASGASSWLRRGLVVLQFGVSAFLIAGTLVVMSQLRFLSDQHLGFDKEHLVTLPLGDPILREQYPAIEDAIRQSPNVTEVAAVNQIPGNLGWTSGFHAEGVSDEEPLYVRGLPADATVADGLGLELVAGAAFPASPPAPDSTNFLYLLNETAARQAGWTAEEAVGKRMAVDARRGEVVGVVRDFHFRSLHDAIDPLAIWYDPGNVRHLVVRLAPGDTRAALGHLEGVWGQFAAHRPFSYRFLDDVYDRLYRSEQQLGRIVSVFAFLAIFVACLGLFGLASFTAERRRKEVGVRKVLGATVPNLVLLLARDFVVLVAVAFVIAVPLVWLGMREWLGGFAYQVGLGPGPFLVAGGLLLAVALVTVSTQALRAASSDPVKALRYE